MCTFIQFNLIFLYSPSYDAFLLNAYLTESSVFFFFSICYLKPRLSSRVQLQFKFKTNIMVLS